MSKTLHCSLRYLLTLPPVDSEASMAGLVGNYGAALYCASKHAVVGFTKSVLQADEDENVKVVTVCPGMVSTPLWTGDAAKDVAKQYSYTDDVCITREEVAQAMLEMVTEGKYGGGSLLEVAKGRLREPLESAQAIVGSDADEAMRAWRDQCYKPIRDVFNSERGAGGVVNGAG